MAWKMSLHFIQTLIELTENMGGFLESQGEQIFFHKRFGIELLPFVLEIVISPPFLQGTENSWQQEIETLTSQTKIFLLCLGIFLFFSSSVAQSDF